jgi:hypothetical protein
LLAFGGVMQVTLGGLPLGLGSEASTLERRVRFHAAALELSVCLRFAVCDRALTGEKLLLDLAGPLCRTTGTEPLADQLEVAVYLGGVIALADVPEGTLNHERRPSLAFTARRHGLAFAGVDVTPAPARLIPRTSVHHIPSMATRRCGAARGFGRSTGVGATDQAG